jgi:DNA-binding FadR family transcriptional regulator
MRDAMLEKVQKQSLGIQVREQLLNYINENKLEPGDKLPPELFLSERLGVSRQIVREALRMLEGSNILTIRNGSGAIISPVDDGSFLGDCFSRFLVSDKNAIFDLLEVRQCLELEAVEKIMKKGKMEYVDELWNAAQGMSHTRNDYHAYAKYDLEFHTIIATGAGNPFLLYLMKPLRAVMEDSILQGMKARKSEEGLETVVKIHSDLARAILAGEYEIAKAGVIHHYENATSYLKK